MTKEEKQLLLKDLCGRLPCGVICELSNNTVNIIERLELGGLEQFITGNLNVLPYLRPMSSMTEEEEKTFRAFLDFQAEYVSDVDLDNKTDMFDWLNEHHFDNRGLIEKGLAFEAPEGMYNIKS